jgi:tight adherence protein B
MSVIVIYALIFAAVLMASDLVFRYLASRFRKTRDINTRLARMRAGTDQLSSYNRLLSERGLAASRLNALSWEWLMAMYRQTGLHMTVQRRLATVLLILGATTLIALQLSEDIVLRTLVAVGLAGTFVIGSILRLRRRRIERFVTQLPPAIDIIVRSLSAGHPLTAAIALVGREMPDPIGSEFGILSDQLTFGAELDVAMLNMVNRVGADELNLLAVTVSVQKSTGGNLSEVLENLSGMIRERAVLRAKIQAVSAEGRITAGVMAAFPFGLFLMIRALVPTYFDPVWESGYGTIAVVTVLATMSFGIFFLYRLVKFDF